MKLLVVGDVVLDKYVILESTGRTTDSRAVKASVVKELDFPGGAAWAATVASRAGHEVRLVTVTGNERDRATLVDATFREGVTMNCVVSAGYSICVKKRIVLDGTEILRIDENEPDSTTVLAYNEWADLAHGFALESDAVLVCDYQKGILTDIDRSQALIARLTTACPWVHVNGKSRELSWYNTARSLQLNETEWLLSDKNWLGNLFITRGENGAEYRLGDRSWKQYPPNIGEIVDTCGAGDVFAVTVTTSQNFTNDTLTRAVEEATRHCTITRWR